MVIKKSMKSLALLLGLCVLPLSVDAQTSNGSTTYFEVNPIFDVSGGSQIWLDLKYGKNWAANDVMSYGFSVGLEEELHFKTWKPNIPLLLRGTFDMNQKEISPFVSLDMGYSVCTAKFKNGTMIVNPAVGVRVKNYYVGVGYLASVGLTESVGTGHNINIRGGYYFNAGEGSLDIKSFLKRTYVTAEIGGGLSLSNYHSYSSHGDKNDDSKLSNKSALININWLYPIDEHWSAGLGTGIRYSAHKDKNDDDSSSKTTSAIPVYIRGQYAFDEIGNDIKPFVACNIGMNMDMGGSWNGDTFNTGFLFEPQAGIIYKDKYSVSLGIEPVATYFSWAGYSKNYEDEYVREKYSQVSLRLGVKL